MPRKPVVGVVFGRLFTFSPPTRASQLRPIDNRPELWTDILELLFNDGESGKTLRLNDLNSYLFYGKTFPFILQAIYDNIHVVFLKLNQILSTDWIFDFVCQIVEIYKQFRHTKPLNVSFIFLVQFKKNSIT